MKDKVLLRILIVIGFISIFGVFPNQTIEAISVPTEVNAKFSGIQDYTPHGAINISGNADFNSTASSELWQGKGTANSPFIIEGYFFNNVSQYNIHIKDTTVHFVIQDVWSTGSINTVGVFIQNASNCIIKNSVIANAYLAIVVDEGENLTISQNTIENCSFASLQIYNVTNSSVVGNSVSNIGYMGAFIHMCDEIEINDNVFTNNDQGLFVYDCNNSEILNNKFEGLRIVDIVFTFTHNTSVNLEIEGGTDFVLGLNTGADYDYLCYRNSEYYFLTQPWYFNEFYYLTLDIDSFDPGLSNYTIIITEKSDGSLISYSTIWLNIRDNTAPQISHPPDIITNSTKLYITWIGFDYLSDTYQVYLNGTQVRSGTWSSSEPIYVYIEGLSPGRNEVTIHLFDSSGNEIADTLLIIVPDLAQSTITITTKSTSGYLIETIVFSIAVLYLYKRRE